MKKLIFSLAILALVSCEKEPPIAKDLLLSQIVVSEWPATRPDGTPWSTNNVFPTSITISERGTDVVLYASPAASSTPGAPIAFFPALKTVPGKELVVTLWALEGQISEIGGYWFRPDAALGELYDSSVGVRFALFWE